MATKTKFRVNADGWWTLRDILVKGEEFNPDSATLKGRRVYKYESRTGWLPNEWADAFKRATYADEVEYVVFSYGTPIAWKLVNGGPWVTPDVKYSVTTSKHQGKVFTAISQLDEGN